MSPGLTRLRLQSSKLHSSMLLSILEVETDLGRRLTLEQDAPLLHFIRYSKQSSEIHTHDAHLLKCCYF